MSKPTILPETKRAALQELYSITTYPTQRWGWALNHLRGKREKWFITTAGTSGTAIYTINTTNISTTATFTIAYPNDSTTATFTII